MRLETYTKKTFGHCKCSPLDVIVRFENSNLTVFNWGHRYTELNDINKEINIFRCHSCKDVIHDNFVPIPDTDIDTLNQPTCNDK